MRHIQKEIYERMTKTCRENGYEPIPGRKLTAEEIAEDQRRSKEIYDFLKELRKYEQDSRKVIIHVK